MKVFIALLKISFFLFLVFLLFSQIDVKTFYGKLTTDVFVSMAAYQIPVLISVLLMVVRFKIILNDRCDYFKLFKSTVLGLGFGLIVPGRAGEFIKPIYLRNATGLGFGKLFFSFIVERSSDLVCIILFSALSIPVLGYSYYYTILIIIVLFVGFVVFNFFVNNIDKYDFIKSIVLKLSKIFPDDVSPFLLRYTVATELIKLLFYGTMVWGVSALSFWIFFHNIGVVEIGFLQSIVLFLASTIGVIFALLPGGVGTYEVAAVVVMKSYGIPSDDAVFYALTLHISGLVIPVLGSFIVVLLEPIGVKEFLLRVRDASKKIMGS